VAGVAEDPIRLQAPETSGRLRKGNCKYNQRRREFDDEGGHHNEARQRTPMAVGHDNPGAFPHCA